MKYTIINNIHKIIIAVIICATIIICTYTIKNGTFGSVADNGTYSYKNLTSANASSTAVTTIRSGVGTLGSMVVNTTHATIIRVYDGTTATSSDATLIASLPASAVVGTYTFDVAVKKGIVLDVPAGFDGNYTVTFR